MGEHTTTRAIWYERFCKTMKVAIAITHLAGGSFAMITNQLNWEGVTHFKHLAITGNHIKDIDFCLAASQTVGESAQVKGDTRWQDLSQSFYPLKYARKMLTQIREVQESVRAEGMKRAERGDWNGVRMQLIRIFEQEQLILRKDPKPTAKYCEYCRASKASAVRGACPSLRTRTHKWVPRTGFNTDYDYFEGTRDSNAMVKRVIFKFNFNLLIQDTVNGGTHCLKIVKMNNDSFYTGFIHLKEYTSLYEVAELLGAAPKGRNKGLVKHQHYSKQTCDLEACQVRGNTTEILIGGGEVKRESKEGRAIWGPDKIWGWANTPTKHNRSHAEVVFHYVTPDEVPTYDDTPCFNLASGIMQAKEELQQKMDIMKLQEENEHLHTTVDTIIAQLTKIGMTDDKNDSDTESVISCMTCQSRREGELRMPEPSAPPKDHSMEVPILGD